MQRGAIRVGTCSWAEKSLIDSGTFYPAQVTSPEARLRYYAARFDTVEVESSFYSIPTSAMVAAWSQRTPAGFLFHLKAHGALTGHAIDAKTLPPEVRELLPAADRSEEALQLSDTVALKALATSCVAALEPLRAARRLGFIVFQFPPWFGYSKANLVYLLHCKELLARVPIAVEFRHGSWLTHHHTDYLLAFLREHRITYIACDEPQYGTLATAPFYPDCTTSIAYLRLHGRNAENWLDHSTPRYDYRYRPDELLLFSAQAERLSEKARMVFIMFNNCYVGHAVSNALHLKRMLARDVSANLPSPELPLHKPSC